MHLFDSSQTATEAASKYCISYRRLYFALKHKIFEVRENVVDSGCPPQA